MARSDNVVRVALTPKYRDVPLLCEMLTYKMGAPPIVQPAHDNSCCTRFTPPCSDFELEVRYTMLYANHFTVAILDVWRMAFCYIMTYNGRLLTWKSGTVRCIQTDPVYARLSAWLSKLHHSSITDLQAQYGSVHKYSWGAECWTRGWTYGEISLYALMYNLTRHYRLSESE